MRSEIRRSGVQIRSGHTLEYPHIVCKEAAGQTRTKLCPSTVTYSEEEQENGICIHAGQAKRSSTRACIYALVRESGC